MAHKSGAIEAHDGRAAHLSGLYLLAFVMIVAMVLRAAHPQIVMQPYLSDERIIAALGAQNLSVEELRQRAEKGDAKAEVALAFRYFKGAGAAKNEPEAYKWLRKAAAQGDAAGEVGLGAWYFLGAGIEPPAYAEGLKWFNRAAAQGNAWGQMAVGMAYGAEREQGLVAKDAVRPYAEILGWLRKAADQGNAVAQESLGVAYANGQQGVPQNYAEALKWYRKAAGQGEVWAQKLIAQMYKEGKGVAQSDAEALKWYHKAAEMGNTGALYDIGEAFLDGKGVPQDYEEARKWFNKASGRGDAAAQARIGWLYQNGKGKSRNYTEAARWYRLAAGHGNLWAQFMLGRLYDAGQGVAQDHAQALEWYRKSAGSGYAWAQMELGWKYYSASDVPQDNAQALEWYRKAAAQGNTQAKDQLALMQGIHADQAETQPDNLMGYSAREGVIRPVTLNVQAAPLDRPDMDDSLLLAWAARAAPVAMIFGLRHDGQRLQYSSRRFTGEGWSDFAAAVEKARAAESATDLQHIVGVEPGGARIIIRQGVFNNRYMWVVRIPLEITYQSEDKTRAENPDVTLWISRVPLQESPFGVKISNWGLTPGDIDIFNEARKAALQGKAAAQYQLGDLYYTGKGVARNYAEAVQWYQKAATQRNAQAQYKLARMYYFGTDIARNYAEALNWYRKAADQGNAAAKQDLAALQAPLDRANMSDMALLSWVSQATAETMTFGYHDYQRRLQYAARYFTPSGWATLTTALTKSRVLVSVQALQQVVSSEPRSAPVIIRQGAVNGQYRWMVKMPLRTFYQSGVETRSDTPDVTLVIGRVPTIVNPQGVAIEQWISVPHDAAWYQKAFNMGQAEIHALFGAKVHSSKTPGQREVDPAYRKAMMEAERLDAAAAAARHRAIKTMEQGGAAAKSALAENYFNGWYGKEDYAQAFKLFQQAARADYAAAQSYLGQMYEDGIGVPQDSVEAYKWLALAAAKNFKDANARLMSLTFKMTPAQIAEARKRVAAWKPDKI